MLSETDRDILKHLLTVGNDTPSGIADGLGSHPKYMSERLSKLEGEGLVEPLGSGPWGLTVEGVRAARSICRSDDGPE